MLSAHVAVEVFHDRTLTSPGPLCKLLDFAVKVVIRSNFQGNAEFGGFILNRIQHTVVTGVQDDQSCRSRLVDLLSKQRSEVASTIFGLIGREFVITHVDVL